MKQIAPQNTEDGKAAESHVLIKENTFSAIVTVSIMLLFTALSEILSLLIGKVDELDIASLFMLAILLIARWTSGYLWSVCAAISGVVIINTIFIYPYYQVNFLLQGYPVIFFSLVLIAVITGTMTVRNKHQLEESRMREEVAQQIAQFSQKLMMVNDYEEIAELCVTQVSEKFSTTVVFFRDKESLQNHDGVVYGDVPDSISVELETAAARTCFATRKESGNGTVANPTALFHYFPLISHDKINGVLGILWDYTIDKESLLRIFIMLDLTALALERQNLKNTAQRIAVEAERESLRSNLLRSISHDLRTPLTGIIGATAALQDNVDTIERESALSLIRDINEDASWLLRMTENLLSVSRLTTADKKVTIKKQDEAVEEVVPEAVMRCKRRMKHAIISVEIPDDPLFVPMSATLIVQVLINLIENGLRHGKAPVIVKVFQNGDYAHFSVRDHGPGLSPEVQKNLFRGVGQKKPESGRGLGIGLSLCKAIIVAHGGEITGRNHEDGGAIFEFTLPLEEDSYESE